MDNRDCIVAGSLTLLLDIVMLFLLFQNNLVTFDKAFIISVLIGHALFYYSLLYQIHYLIDVLHVFMFLCLNSAFFLKNKFLLGLNLFLIATIQILWIVEERCILNREPNQFGFGKWISTYILLLTIALSIKFGWILFDINSPHKETL
jgi:hypothetical protein